MTSYTSLVHSFIPLLKKSTELSARIWNELHPFTLSAPEKLGWTPLDAEDATDLVESIETLRQSDMKEKLTEMGWDTEEIEDALKSVAIDDSYAISALLNIQDPNNPTIVLPHDFPAFAKHCGSAEDEDEDYILNGILTWKALEEYAPTFAAAKHIVITLDCEVLSLPLPSLPSLP